MRMVECAVMVALVRERAAADTVADITAAHSAPNPTLTCQGDNLITCDLRVHGPEHEVIADGGIRICRTFEDSTPHSLCVNRTGTIMGFNTDTCGCCGATCPDPCTKCTCTQEDADGNILYEGYEMEFTSRGWLGFGDERQTTRCVSKDFTVDAQLHGGTCVMTCSP
jgi:hypothetical protein